MQLIPWLGTDPGRTVLFNVLVISGLAYDKIGVPWAEHFTLATTCVALVKIASGDMLLGWRIIALLALIQTGVVATLLGVESGQMVALSTLAVLLEVLRAGSLAKR